MAETVCQVDTKKGDCPHITSESPPRAPASSSACSVVYLETEPETWFLFLQLWSTYDPERPSQMFSYLYTFFFSLISVHNQHCENLNCIAATLLGAVYIILRCVKTSPSKHPHRCLWWGMARLLLSQSDSTCSSFLIQFCQNAPHNNEILKQSRAENLTVTWNCSPYHGLSWVPPYKEMFCSEQLQEQFMPLQN